MSYSGYINFFKEILNSIPNPSVIEIGTDQGQTLIPLLHHLTITKKNYNLYGVDIKLPPHLHTIISNWTFVTQDQVVEFHIKNSLEYLPIAKNKKYDLILLDADHNYLSVSQELEYLKNNCHDKTIIVCDDYDGRWATEDLFYSTREEYKNIPSAIPFQQTEKHGVKTAVDEFVSKNPEWNMLKLYTEEPPVFLCKDLTVFTEYNKAGDSKLGTWSIKKNQDSKSESSTL